MSQPNVYNEKQLLQQTALGDESAFTQLFNRHHQVLGDYILALTRSKEAAEEIVQDAFIKVWQLRKELPAVQDFRPWLFRICRNRAYNLLRDQARLALKKQEWLHSQSLASTEDEPNDREQLLRLIETAVGQLPAQQRRAYLLSRSQGLSYEAIAEEMQLSRATVKRHISLALQAIADYLRDHPSGFLALLLFSKNL